MAEPSVDIKSLAWIKAGKNRRDAMETMDRKMYTPLDISRATGIPQRAVTRVLRDFESRKIAECVNPEANKGRMYKLTKKGLGLKKEM